MARSSYMLLLRGTTYYYRRAVDKRLRPLLGGRSQIWKSLRTSDLDTAKLRSLQVGQQVERQLQDLRRRASSAQTNPESLARLYSSRAESEDAAWRARRTMDDTDEQSGTRIALPPDLSAKDVPVGSSVLVTVTRTERGEWTARRIEHEPRRNGRGRP